MPGVSEGAPNTDLINVGVLGATGYTGIELVRLLAVHPNVRLVYLTSDTYAGKRLCEVYPSTIGSDAGELVLSRTDETGLPEGIDALFCALPPGLAVKVAPAALSKGIRLIDLSADFRLKDAADYPKWYSWSHDEPGLLQEAAYGLPELHRDEIARARLVANPGCYPTAVLLGLAPLISEGLANGDALIIDAKSGISGAGRGGPQDQGYSELNENLRPYNVGGSHRHIPEIEQELAWLAGRPVRVCFTPHLVPMTRGILGTMYAHLLEQVSTEEAVKLYRQFYAGKRFVQVLNSGLLPETKAVWGTNNCHIGIKVDYRAGRVLVFSVIDNLGKGAAGQAVQNMNIMFGLPETTGLNCLPVFP